MNSLLEKIREDLKKGIEDGISALKEGATTFYDKVDGIKAAAKKQYNIFDLQTKIQDEMTKLGGRAYDVYNSNKSIDEDKKIKAAFVRIKKLEWQLAKLEGAPEVKPASSRKAAPKTKVKEAAPRTSAKTSPVKAKKTAAKKPAHEN